MSEKELLSYISESLRYCHGHSCALCPKSDFCGLIFGDRFIESEIYDLGLRCLKFNEACIHGPV